MAERGIKWRSPGDVWRAYAATHCTGDYDCSEPVHVEGCYGEYAQRNGRRDLV